MRSFFVTFIDMGSIKDTYTTIQNEGSSLYKEKGSKFFGYAFHATSENEAKSKLDQIRQEHHQSRHVCYAYILDFDEQLQRANDDGEPSHSAGTPILNQIKSFELVQCVVAVVRYFGGTKLGVSGLITAYKTAAKEALEDAQFETIYRTTNVEVSVPFEDVNAVMRMTKTNEVAITDQVYTDVCTVHLVIRDGYLDYLIKQLQKLHRANIKVAGELLD